MKMILISLPLFTLLFSGCVSSYFTIGEEHGYCEEHGCDYSDAGVCGDPYNILENKDLAKKLAYKRIHCDCEETLNVPTK